MFCIAAVRWSRGTANPGRWELCRGRAPPRGTPSLGKSGGRDPLSGEGWWGRGSRCLLLFWGAPTLKWSENNQDGLRWEQNGFWISGWGYLDFLFCFCLWFSGLILFILDFLSFIECFSGFVVHCCLSGAGTVWYGLYLFSLWSQFCHLCHYHCARIY